MKYFDMWNNLKKLIEKRVIEGKVFFYEREVWWCSLGLNIGIESNGKNDSFERPVLIFKVFNKHMIWCLPITSNIKNSPFYYKVRLNDEDQSIMITQIRTISSKRLLRKIGTINEKDFNKVKDILTLIIKNESPLKGDNLGGRSR